MEQEHVARCEYRWEVPYKVTLGETYARFMEGLKQKKIMGNICPNCNGLYVPARPFCDECLVAPVEWTETDGIATLVTYTVTYVKVMGLPDPPSITGIVNVGNAVTNFQHFIAGVDYEDPRELEQKIYPGMKLKPVWKEERVGDILDIKYFEPL